MLTGVNRKRAVVLSILGVILMGCKEVALENDMELQTLKSWMVGSFNSLEQSQQDTNFYNIHLEMVSIWPDQKDAEYLYVEQAASWALDKPYRQRIYRLSRDGAGVLESAVYLIQDPLRFTGDWNKDQPLGALTSDSLKVKDGCAIKLAFKDDAFVGGTVGEGCLSSLRGAAFATSKVNIAKSVLTSWDQGFDSTGVQVWGAVTGPYIFKKINRVQSGK